MVIERKFKIKRRFYSIYREQKRDPLGRGRKILFGDRKEAQD